jgi:hypothetical protein
MGGEKRSGGGRDAFIRGEQRVLAKRHESSIALRDARGRNKKE